MARRITARIVSSSAGVGGPTAMPLAYIRTVAPPTNDPTFTDMPCRSIALSQASKPCAPRNSAARRRASAWSGVPA